VIFLHIGRHKTGTTALQQLLRKNRRRLAEHGYNYLSAVKGGPGNHTLAHALDPERMAAADAEQRAVYAEELEVTGRRLRHRGHAIVSSEAFQHIPPPAAAGFFPRGETTVVVYLREQLDYLLSAYAQFIQNQPVRMALLDYAARAQPRYDRFLEGWADAFGRERVRPRIYARERLKDGDVRQDFLALAGIDPAWLEFREGFGNPSIGPELIEAKGLLNGFVPAEVLKRLDAFTLFADLAAEGTGRLRVSEGFAQTVRARFAASNARLFETWPELGAGFPMTDLSPPSPAPVPYDALQQVLARLDARAAGAAAELRRHLPDEATLRAQPRLLPSDWHEAEARLAERWAQEP
jgi:hypothetical protein